MNGGWPLTLHDVARSKFCPAALASMTSATTMPSSRAAAFVKSDFWASLIVGPKNRTSILYNDWTFAVTSCVIVPTDAVTVCST